MVQRQVLYLGELDDNQRAGWIRTVEVVTDKESPEKQLALFPDDCEALPIPDGETVRVRLDKIELHHPREWGASWLGLQVLGQAGTGYILEETLVVKPQGDKLAEYAEGH